MTDPIMQQILPPATAADAQTAIAEVGGVIDTLMALVEKETALVRKGRLSEAATLEKTKSELAGRYLLGMRRLNASPPRLRAELPAAFAALRARHRDFQDRLRLNLTVLATAHAVSEGIMRGVAEQVSRKAAPQTYGASGRQVYGAPPATQPLAVSRTL
jgi:hypothetical protein